MSEAGKKPETRHEPLSVDVLKLDIETSVEMPGMAAEIRTYEWPDSDSFFATTDYIYFTRILTSDHIPQPVQWKMPGSKRFITVGPIGITPARTKVIVRRQPDAVRCLLLRVEPETFRALTALDSDWYDEKLILLLNKEGFGTARLLEEVADELTAPGHASVALVQSLATAFLVRFGRLVRAVNERSGSGLSGWQLGRVRELVETKPANQLDIDLLARACGISGRHLMRGFKAATGLTVHRYIQQVRVDRTKHLLTSSKLPLDAIAAEVGFASASHLSNAFRQQVGMVPSVFRQKAIVV